MTFIHAVVLDNPVADEDKKWWNLTSGDYIVHGLYNVGREQLIVLNDNTHSPIEDIIEAFIQGVEYQGGHIDSILRVLVIADDPYNKTEVAERISQGLYEVIE